MRPDLDHDLLHHLFRTGTGAGLRPGLLSSLVPHPVSGGPPAPSNSSSQWVFEGKGKCGVSPA
jgi:hypothetical protein